MKKYEPKYVDSNILVSTIAFLVPLSIIGITIDKTYKVILSGLRIICGQRLGVLVFFFARMYEYWNSAPISLLNNEFFDGITITKSENSNDIYIKMPSLHGVIQMIIIDGIVEEQ